jgi:transcriptional regulator with XRE-family HTH domain
LAGRLASRRDARGASLAEVARDAGLSKAYVHKLERGEAVRPSPRVLRALAGALDVSYAELMRLAGYL